MTASSDTIAGDTATRLLAAAVEEFAEHGFQRATIRDICARAEVNLNAVKYHFSDKQGLYVAAVKHAHAASKHLQHSPLANQPDAPAEARLREFIENMLKMALADEREPVANRILLMREMLAPSQAAEEIVQSVIKPLFARLDRILTELLPPSTTTMDRHLLALSVIGQCLHYKLGRQIDKMIIAASEYRRFTLPRLTEHIASVTMASVEARWAMTESAREAG